MFTPENVCGYNLEIATALLFICFLQFSVSSWSMWVSFTLFLLFDNFSLWGSLSAVAPLGTKNCLFFVSFLCCCVSLLSPLQPLNSIMKTESTWPLNTYGLSSYVFKKQKWVTSKSLQLLSQLSVLLTGLCSWPRLSSSHCQALAAARRDFAHAGW